MLPPIDQLLDCLSKFLYEYGKTNSLPACTLNASYFVYNLPKKSDFEVVCEFKSKDSQQFDLRLLFSSKGLTLWWSHLNRIADELASDMIDSVSVIDRILSVDIKLARPRIISSILACIQQPQHSPSPIPTNFVVAKINEKGQFSKYLSNQRLTKTENFITKFLKSFDKSVHVFPSSSLETCDEMDTRIELNDFVRERLDLTFLVK